MIVCPGTSEIHSETFGRALGATVDTSPSGSISLWVGVGPHLKDQVEAYEGKKVAYWIGSDALCALQDPWYRKLIPNFDLHLCVHERTQEELALWKVASRVVYPCSRYEGGQQEIKTKAVGVYSPTPYHPQDLYLYKECVEIAKECPEVPFLFFGQKEELKDLPPNCRDMGREDPDKIGSIYDNISVILRLVTHDGNPVGGIEAMQRGINVIENYPYLGFTCPLRSFKTMYGDKTGLVMKDVVDLINGEDVHKPNTGPWPAYYRDRCSPAGFKKAVEKELLLCGLPTS